MSFDIGIGKCCGIADGFVDVSLDSAMVSRLIPAQGWRKSGSSTLRLPLRLCSQKRPPIVGNEVYLPQEALSKSQKGSLDLHGDGNFAAVELMALVKDLDPPAMNPPSAKPRSSRW